METGVSVTQLQPAAAERFVSLRRELGVTSFGINQIILRPGERGRIHRHERQEEVYLVIDGTLTVFFDGEPTDTPPAGWCGSRRRCAARSPTWGRAPC